MEGWRGGVEKWNGNKKWWKEWNGVKKEWNGVNVKKKVEKWDEGDAAGRWRKWMSDGGKMRRG